MRTRLSLHNELLEIIDSVYYQPPSNHRLSYPCILYKKDAPDLKMANNKKYIKTNKYTVIYISKDPDDTVVDEILVNFDNCVQTNSQVVDNLYHRYYTLYY